MQAAPHFKDFVPLVLANCRPFLSEMQDKLRSTGTLPLPEVQTMTQPNFLNRTLFHGDNLDFLRGMNSETVHLVATDPPFAHPVGPVPANQQTGWMVKKWSQLGCTHERITRREKALPAQLVSSVVTWTVLVALWLADALIWIMLRARSNERLIRPTDRVAWPKGLKRQLMRRQDNTCVYCGHRRTAPSLDIDHIVPVVRGGSNNISNLQVICRPCNQRKGLQTDEEFRARYARLASPRRLTPPRRRISQHQFAEETRRTRQLDSVQRFRQTRFISKRSKVSSGCLILGIAVAAIIMFPLASAGVEGYPLLLPSLILGGAAGFGVWLRAYITGAMIEGEDA